MTEWTKNMGFEPILPKGTIIDVRFAECGGECYAGFAEDWHWGTEEGVGAITEWRVSDRNIVTDASPNSAGDAVGVNPKESLGQAKLPLHLWSPLATAYGSIGLLNGGKYGYGNYKATPVLASIYIAAIKRHLSAWEEGQECDEADGVPHLGAVLANVAILLESRAVGTMVDDRQIRGGYLKEVEMLTKIANSVQEMHSDKHPRHYTIADNAI